MTIIGKLDDLKAFDENADIDSWRKSGRVPGMGDPPVTWTENKQWLDDRIARGDQFGLATDPNALPPIKGATFPVSRTDTSLHANWSIWNPLA
jgi:hypothetical protein